MVIHVGKHSGSLCAACIFVSHICFPYLFLGVQKWFCFGRSCRFNKNVIVGEDGIGDRLKSQRFLDR